MYDIPPLSIRSSSISDFRRPESFTAFTTLPPPPPSSSSHPTPPIPILLFNIVAFHYFSSYNL